MDKRNIYEWSTCIYSGIQNFKTVNETDSPVWHGGSHLESLYLEDTGRHMPMIHREPGIPSDFQAILGYEKGP